MKYKVGDKVRIKNLDWYYENRDKIGRVDCGSSCFIPSMVTFCGQMVTILTASPLLEVYRIKEDGGTFNWTGEMIEGLAERNGKTYPYKIGDRVILKGSNRCATITDLKYNSCGNLSYYIKIDNDKDISIDCPTELLLPYDNKVEGLVEEKTKPKFNVGDRVITDTNMKGKIIEDVEEGWYRVEFEPYNNIPQPNGIVPEESMSLVEEEDKETNWKPSKEEMDVLYGLAYITNKYDEHKEEVIARLYQDLKREFFNGSSYENMFPNTENDVRRRSTIQVLEYARSLDHYNQYGKADIDKNIAWLEKQGKSALEARTDNELVEDEVGLVDKLSSRCVNEFNLPEGYIFKDENGNIINATKIVLEKKKKEYPKTYEECCRVVNANSCIRLVYNLSDGQKYYHDEDNLYLYENFRRLKICRDAYWKIAGEEMGLGKPWEPDWTDNHQKKWTIHFYQNEITLTNGPSVHFFLAFPTEKMRDAFYENFKELIEKCKELL